jgi:photosystem II stability/assembly factor-like uncharacterized protein
MKNIVFALLLACPLLLAAQAQQAPTPVYVAPDAPDWMHKMQAERPNVFEIQKAYNTYFSERPFEKNRYTQFYKRWMRWARPYTQADGSLKFPTPAEDAARQVQMQNLRRVSRGTNAEHAAAEWSFVGPKQTYHTDGTTIVTWQTNIYSFDVSLSDPNTLYAGGESGGFWKSTDKGMNWTLLSAGITHGAFGATKIHPTDPKTVYTATGGKILKSTDGGATWASVYTESNLWVNEFAISTANPDIILAAADQGLLRSTNGGTTWNKLYTNQSWTVKFKVGDPNTVFAVRKNGSNCDFMKSTNAGSAFFTSNTGLWTPGSGESVGGAIIAVCPSDPARLYLYLCGNGSNLYGYIGVYKSTNSGAAWSNTNPLNSIGNSPTAYAFPAHTNLMAHNGTTGFDQGFYDMAIVVNPSNADQIIAGGTSWFRSNNGGQTWTALGSYVGGLSWSHPDIQCTVAVGNDLWISSDGGLNYSSNWASTIEARMNGISGADMWGFDSGWNEDLLVGGRYHNGNMAYHESFPAGKFYRMGGAEAATGYVSPGPERKVYHSDIGGDIIKGGLNGGVSGFSVGLFPNESYAYYANSEMEWAPDCWNTVYLGYEQKIWKSTNGGATFSALYTFPGTADNTVFDIEIARSNPQIMYCSQWDGTDDAIWRSTDGGLSWTACTLLPLPNNNDRVKLAVSAENAKVLWAAVTYGSNGKKIYKTTDGGLTWINLTTALLNNIRITNIMAQYGTDGGIYLGTDGGVFYRNNSHSDWQPYSQALPLSAETNRLKPFYRDGKIRNGCWGFGVWEAPLFENSKVIPQAMTDKMEASCARDTFYFDDHSVVNHAGASWSWAFSDAQTVIGADTRTPKVVFGNTGEKSAIMTLNTPDGVYRDTLTLRVGDGCALDSIPGNALQLDGNGDYVAAGRALNLNSNTVTLMAWVKPNGTQNDWAGLVFCRGGSTTAGMSLRTNNELRYHWNDSGYNFSSGLLLPDNQWSHVAMVVTPTGVTLYLNGKAASSSGAQPLEAFDAPIKIGHDNGSRYFKGLVDEVCVYDRALTQEEVRTQMHLAKSHTDRTGLRTYYQFNENQGPVLDRINTNHGSVAGNGTRIRSTAPFGPGVAFLKTVNSGKRHTFGQTGLTLVFGAGATLPLGDLAVTRLNIKPDTLSATTTGEPQYWILENFGTNQTFTAPTEIYFDHYGPLPADLNARAIKLLRRTPNGDGLNWNLIDSADYVTAGFDASVIFKSSNQLKTAGQYYLSVPGVFSVKQAAASKPVAADRTLVLTPEIQIYPNPVAVDGRCTISANTDGLLRFRLFDSNGHAVKLLRFERNATLDLKDLKAGVYFYQIENEHFIKSGRLLID